MNAISARAAQQLARPSAALEKMAIDMEKSVPVHTATEEGVASAQSLLEGLNHILEINKDSF